MTSDFSNSPHTPQDQFDIGPLSWVMGEVREAISNAGKMLTEAVAQDAETRSTSLLHAKSYLHQAHGALQIVDIEGVSIVTETIEDLIDRLQGGQLEMTQAHVDVIVDAFYAVLRYLEDLLSGAAHQPVRLFPYYRALLEIKGAERIHPADLFFPALSVREPIPELAVQRTAAPVAYPSLRQRFEKLLLTVLTSKDKSQQLAAVQAMHALISEIEQGQTNSQAKAFWVVMRAFAEAVAQGAIENQQYVKQIFGRINLQIRRLVDGVSTIPERLLRDALFFLAQVEQPSPFVTRIRHAYQLDNQVPLDYDQKNYGQITAGALAATREQLSAVKNLWGRIANGETGLADKFSQKMKDLADTGAALNAPALSKLLRELNGIARHVAHSPDGSKLGLELATSLLFVENALDQITRLPAHFAERAEEITARLLSVVSGDEPQTQAAWMGEISREAQQRQTMTVLVTEMQASLRQVEKTLDEYFRDPSDQNILKPVDGVLHQIGGALAILDQDDAMLAVEHTRRLVSRFAEADAEIADAGLNESQVAAYQNVAQNIGALSFFIETLQSQPEAAKKKFSFDAEAGVFRSNLLEKAAGKELLPGADLVREPEFPGQEAAAHGDTVLTAEQELANQQQESARLAASLAETPENQELQAQLKESLESERSVATLLDDADAGGRARAAIDLLGKSDFAPSSEAMHEIVAATAAPAPALSLVQAPEVPESEAAIDAELLEIFLTEADEVLAFVRETVPSSKLEPGNQEYLTSLRRSFHTLKGSSRMVGLSVFGETAWAIEQVMNLWLSESRAGNEHLFALLERAAAEMVGWVEELKQSGYSGRNGAQLIVAAERVKTGLAYCYEEAAQPESDILAAADSTPQPETAAMPEMAAIVEDIVAAPVAEPVAQEIAEEISADAAPAFELGSFDELPSAAMALSVTAPAEPVEVADAAGILDSSFTLEFAEPVAKPVAEPDVGQEVPAAAAAEPAPADDLPTMPVPVAEHVQSIEPEPETQSETAALQELFAEAVEEQEPEREPESVSGSVQEAEPEPNAGAAPEALPEPEMATLEEFAAALEHQGAAAPLTPEIASPADLLALLQEEADLQMREELVASPASAQIIEFPDLSRPVASQDDNIKRIGDIEISLPLHTIYMAETDEIVRFLAQDFAEWRHEPERHVSTHAVHAAHSLAGSSATVGLKALQELAHSLELVLQRLERHPVPLLVEEYDVLEHALDVAKRMLQKFALSEMAAHAPDDVRQLELLLQEVIARSNGGADEEFITSTNEKLDLAALTEPQTEAEATPEAGHEAEDQPESPAQPVPDSAPFVAATPEPAFALPQEIAAAETAADAMADVGVLQVKDDLDLDLLPVFIEEGNDLLPMVGQLLRSWQQQPEDNAIPQSIARLMHTIKGSARMAGAMGLGQHIHDMEARIESLMHGSSVVRQPLLEDLLARHDHSMQLFDRLQHPAAPQAAATGQVLTAAQELDQFQEAMEAQLAGSAPAAKEIAGLTSLVPVLPVLPAGGAAALAASKPAAAAVAPAGPVTLVRVRADILDRLVNQAGEVSISRSRLENEVSTLRASLGELTENVNRLRDQLREVEIQAETQITSRMAHSADREFDPLEFDRFTRLQELTRMMAESVSDVATVQNNLTRTIDGASNDLHMQARLTRDLQQDLMRVRMIPFASISERLYRVTRQTAKELDKRVNLDIRGAGVELDRGVLEKMAGPFEHLLRNAIVHGIETREQRRALGKEETGELLIEVRQEGNEVVIRFSDDGQGLNLERIRDKARAIGLIAHDELPGDAETANMIFEPGFSTASEVTELAGRGVGMDVVRSEAASLGGRVEVSSNQGKGADFAIRLPLTLAVTQVVLLSSGGLTFAVPSVLVEQVQQLKANTLANAYNDGAVLWQGQRVAMYYLSTLLGQNDVAPLAQQYTPLLIMKSGTERVAIHVDDILGNREVVVKNIGPQLARMTGIAGATVLGSGEIVLILNPVPLAHRMEHEHALKLEHGMPPAPEMGAVADLRGSTDDAAAKAEPVQGLRAQRTVMVVDDSLTVRRVTQRLLTREGYQVILAKDGIDALEQLQSVTPDVMLVDIEMPRMDGFDLTRNVRSDTRTSHIPIIMITSRTADKHRNYAKELGVNEYFGKPYREDDLLGAITHFLGKEALSV